MEVCKTWFIQWAPSVWWVGMVAISTNPLQGTRLKRRKFDFPYFDHEFDGLQWASIENNQHNS